MKIGDVVAQELTEFGLTNLELVDGLTFNQRDILKRIRLYLNDQYEQRSDDAIFWNLSTPRVPHFAKNIDLDTKDLYPFGVGETNFTQAWILRQRFSRWVQDSEMALILNDLAEGLARTGSVVWKKVKVKGKTSIQEVQLLNLYFDPAAKEIREEDVVETHMFTKAQLRKKRKVWDNVEEVLSRANREGHKPEDGVQEIEIWERWGDYEDDDGKEGYWQHIGHGLGDDAVVMFEKEWKRKDSPYYDFHVEKYNGRWLRRGVVERLFKLQERANALVNQNAQTTEIASLLLLRTAEGELNGNVLSQAETGQIINSGDLQQIPLQNTGIQNFIAELRLIEEQSDRLAFTPNVVTGESLPSGTPFRSVATLSNAAKSVFNFIRQSVGEKISFIMLKEILPDIVKDWNHEDLLEIAGDEGDLKVYDEAVQRTIRWNTFTENLFNFKVTEQVDLDAIEAKVDEQLTNVVKKVKMPKNFFNFKYGIRLNVTGESFDKAQQNDAMFNAIQFTMSNPAITDIPLFKQMLENNGISWWKLTPDQRQAIQQSATGAPAPEPKQEDALLSLVDSQ